MNNLRTATIRLAFENPNLRPVLLPLIFGKEAGDVIDLAERRRLLQTLRADPTEVSDEAEGYAAIVALLRRLQAGDKVVVTYRDVMRGGEVKSQRVVSKSWQDLKDFDSRFAKAPRVSLEAKVKGGDTYFKSGMIADYGDGYGVQWQPTMKTQVTQVLALKKV
jgi:hypothetical protein